MRILYWSRGAEELYGWKRDEAVGKLSHELLETTFPVPLDQIRAELARMDRWEGELVQRKRDGTQVVVASRWSLRRDRQGRPTSNLVTNTDTTESKRAHESLQKAQADLVRVNRVMLLGEMTASIAHEVNQPISGAITNANAGLRWLAAQPPDVEEARAALGRILRDGNRANEVIGRVRTLVKKVPLRKNPVDIKEAIREAIALTDGELRRHNVKLLTGAAERDVRHGGVPIVAEREAQVPMDLFSSARGRGPRS
jgi:PAS domain S-box-containing protein